MKRNQLAVLGLALAVCLGGCGSSATQTSSSAETSSDEQVAQQQTEQKVDAVTVKQSPDKYTWYMKNYVGMNAAGVGYTSLSGQRMDVYGAGYIKIVFVTPDGTHIDFSENDDQLKGYKVSAQSYEPNTEIKYTFQTDSDGKEYDSLVEHQSIEEIVLSVDKVGENGNSKDSTAIQASPDKYSVYVRDYVGRNLRDCGYVSLVGKLTDSYGAAYIHFNLVTDDGSAVDLEDEAAIANYVVNQQDVQPNTAVSLTFDKDSDGKEYSNIVSDQSLEVITLYVSPISSSSTMAQTHGSAQDQAGTTAAAEDEGGSTSSADIRQFVDDYEAWMNSYCDFMEKYNSTDNKTALLGEYAQMMTDYAEWTKKYEDYDTSNATAEDLAYYNAANARILERLSKIN